SRTRRAISWAYCAPKSTTRTRSCDAAAGSVIPESLGGAVGHDAPMTPLARQRAATVAVWRADVATRPHGDWADLGGLAVHTTGIAIRHWNGAHATTADGLGRMQQAAKWFAARAMPWAVLVPAELYADPGTPLITEQPVMLRELA